MDRGFVAVSFGTSVPEARRAVTAVEDVLRRTAPDWETVQAFTSPTIRRILAKRGEDVPSLPEALERLRSKGVRRAAVQPTHLLYGFEYDRLRAEAEALAKKIVDCHYDFGPGAVCEVMEVDGMIWVSADFQKEEDIIFPMPEELARLAEEAGLSEIVKYSASVNGGRAYKGPTTSPDRTITNPDT